MDILHRKNGSDVERIWIEINPDGSLVLHGQDLGPRVEEQWGRDEYEYSLTIPASEKDRVLLELLKEKYADTRCSQQLRDWLTEKKIPHEFSNH
ncbi:hypothetical protein KBD59_03015 [Candidatus Gracilibacteria bacterium]|nr:hypothetical protein [Candidatus Gracilibacteria bacterium]